MAVDKFKFVSPGVFIDEIDESAIPELPERMGPLIIGRFQKGPAHRPVQVNSFKEFVATFGNPSDGNASGDIFRSGVQKAPRRPPPPSQGGDARPNPHHGPVRGHLMDPDAALAIVLSEARKHRPSDLRTQAIDDLRHWVTRGGFLPDLTVIPGYQKHSPTSPHSVGDQFWFLNWLDRQREEAAS